MVSRRVQDLGLKVSTKTLAPTASLSELLDNIAKKGLLYAVIITSQHEVHGSLTLTILYGRNPQGMCYNLCPTTCKMFTKIVFQFSDCPPGASVRMLSPFGFYFLIEE